MASLSDILTVGKNIVTAINGISQNYINVQGAQNSGKLTVATLVQLGAGRVANVVVTTAGTTVGYVYDANSTSSTSNPIYVIPNTVGLVFVNMPVGIGLVVAPGTGQAVTISYS